MDAHRPHTDASEAVQAECPVRCSDDSLGAYGQRLGVLSGSDSRRHTVPPADSAGFAFAGSARWSAPKSCVRHQRARPPDVTHLTFPAITPVRWSGALLASCCG